MSLWKNIISISSKILNIFAFNASNNTIVPGDTVNLNDGMGQSKYKWSADKDVTVGAFTKTSTARAVTTDTDGTEVVVVEQPTLSKKQITLNATEKYACYTNENNGDIYALGGVPAVDKEHNYKIIRVGANFGKGYYGFSSTNCITITNAVPSFNKCKIYIKCYFTTDTSNQAILGFNDSNYWMGIETVARFWVGSWVNGKSVPQGTDGWICLDYSDGTNFKYYTLLDQGYTLETLPELKFWNFECSTTNNFLVGKHITLGRTNEYTSRYFRGIIRECQIILDDTEWFNLATAQEGTDYTNTATVLDLTPYQYSCGTSGYIKLKQPINYANADSWSVTVYARLGTGISSNAGAVISNPTGIYHTPMVYTNSTGRLRLYISSNGTSWDIADNVTSALGLVTGQYYFIQLSFTGTEYKVAVSRTGQFAGEEQNYITVQSTTKAYYDGSVFSFFNDYSNTYTPGRIDTAYGEIVLDGTKYLFGAGKAVQGIQLYTKAQSGEFVPVQDTENVFVDTNDNIVISGIRYFANKTKDVVVPAETEYNLLSTDITLNKNVFINQSELGLLDTKAQLTEKIIKIDTSVYSKFDIEELNGFTTAIEIAGENIDKTDLPKLAKNGSIIAIKAVKDNDGQVWGKTFNIVQDTCLRKQQITFTISNAADILIDVTGLKYKFTNTTSCQIEAYDGDYITYTVTNNNYATYTGTYTVSGLPMTQEHAISITLTPVYKCTFNVVPADAKIELGSTNTYEIGDNWIKVYGGATVAYTISKDGYTTVSDSVDNVSADQTINVTLVAITENNVVAGYDTRNTNSYRTNLYRNTEDHLIAYGENTVPAYSNYPYLLNEILLPLDTAKSWEIQTRYRYLGGSTYAEVFGSGKDNFAYGGINLYVHNGVFKVDLSQQQVVGNYQISGQSTGLTATSGYEYKFKAGWILEDNEWTANDGGGTKSTFTLDYIRSERDNTLNPTLTANGTMGGDSYACASSDSNVTAYNAFNSNDNVYINPTVATDLSPVWLTYYTPTAIKPKSFTIVNDDTLNNIKNAVFEGSTDNTNWDTLYTITNRGQAKNLVERYYVNTDGKYNYFRLNITETYSQYTQTERQYQITESKNFGAKLVEDFFNKALYGDHLTGIANFEFDTKWKLNGNDVSIANYLQMDTLDIVGTLTEDNKVFSGFSDSNYILVNNSFNNETTSFEIVFKVKQTSRGSNSGLLDSNTTTGQNIRFTITDSGYPRLRVNNSLSSNTYKVDITGSTVVPLNEWTYCKATYDSSTGYTVSTSLDGITWTGTATSAEKSAPLYQQGIMWYIGDNVASGYSLNGSIDLKESFVTNNGTTLYWKDLIPNNGDNITVYYSTNNIVMPVNSTNLKQFVIDGFPFTYATDTYTRAYTYTRNEKEYNIVDGELVSNPNYVDNKSVYVASPLSFLNSPISLADHYSLGHIDLTDTKCYIDGNLYWQADKPFAVGDEIKLTRGYGLTDNEWTVSNNLSDYVGAGTFNGEIVSINNDDTVTVKPLYYLSRGITLTSLDDSEIQTVGELPTKTITFTTDDDVILDLSTYASDKNCIKPTKQYREVYMENIPGQTITMMVAGQHYELSDQNMIEKIYVPAGTLDKNEPTMYSYNQFGGTAFVYTLGQLTFDNGNVESYVHTFKVLTDVSGCTITYNVEGIITETIDGSTYCKNLQNITYTISKVGYAIQTGSYTVPRNDLFNGYYTVSCTLDPLVTLTLNSSEQDSVYEIECAGYEQENNTITTKQGMFAIEGDNLNQSKYINNGCLVEVEE